MISAACARLRSFGRFWWDFIIGDDWRLALAVVVGLAVTYLVVAAFHVPAWWIVPATIVAALPVSVTHAAQRR